MTNYESIKQGTNKAFNELLEKMDTEALTEMLSENPCKRCVCKTYCDNSPHGLRHGGICQDIIEEWLNKEEKDEE